MNHRLVGAVIIGCLAIIFIPIFLDGEGIISPELLEQAPPTPSIPAVPQIEPQRPVIRADTDAIILTEETLSVNEPELDLDVISLGAQGLPEPWSVRLGTFGDKKNADTLIARLIQAGHKAYSKPSNSNQGQLTAVFVGPLLNRDEANELQITLEKQFFLNGIVVEFSIDELPQ